MMIRALSACNSSSLTLYLYCKRRQNHFSMVLVVKHNSYKINLNLDLLPKQRWQIDAIGVLEGVTGDITLLQLREVCVSITKQHPPVIRKKDLYLAQAPAHDLKDLSKILHPIFLYSTGGSVLGGSCTKQVFLMSELQSFYGSDP